MATEHNGLPVAGYKPQSEEKVAIVNGFKADEERLLRKLDDMMLARAKDAFEQVTDSEGSVPVYDGRWLAIARSHFEQGFMALNRAVFQPGRVKLPEDE